MGEADALTALERRSKAYWGYSDEFMAQVADELRLTAQDVAEDIVQVVESDTGQALGFYRLERGEPIILEDLWVEPSAIGRGLGRLLWEHAVATSRELGAAALDLHSDPNAVGFYRHMGARQVGMADSRLAKRQLPVMRFELK